jgi:RimJ/RimL family protein N-acetyltransferase
MTQQLVITESNRKRGLCLAHTLLFGHDMPVAAWTWNEFKITAAPINAAIGLVDRNNQLVGSAIFQNFTGYNVELSYYGYNTFSANIARSLARFTILRFNIDRLTMRTNRKNSNILKMFHRLGFKFEGVQKSYYGPFGDAAVFVLFREDLERIGNINAKIIEDLIS